MKSFYMLLLSLLVTSSATAQPSPVNYRWRGNLIEFFFRQRGTEEGLFRQAFAEAMTRWDVGTVAMRLVNSSDGYTPCKRRPPGTRVINFAGITASLPDECGQFKPDELAITYTIRNEDGEIVASDIFFKGNASLIWSIYDGPLQERFDFRRVALHELGHAAGLNLTGPRGEDNHDRDPSSIMFKTITNTYLPSPLNLSTLRSKYQIQLPPAPPESPNFKCPTAIPYEPVVEMGTITSTKYLLEYCLDRDQFASNFYFTFAVPHRAKISVVGTNGGKSVNLVHDNNVIWSAPHSGDRTKSLTAMFQAGRYQIQISNGATSGPFKGAIEFLP